MTVKELIKELSRYPEDMPVFGYHHGNYGLELNLREVTAEREPSGEFVVDMDGFDSPFQSLEDNEKVNALIIDWR